MAQLSIGEVARRAECPPIGDSLLRRGGRAPGGAPCQWPACVRPDVLVRLALVRMAQEAGFTIAEIRLLVEGFDQETPASERWRALAKTKLVEVDTVIARAQRMRGLLEQALQCGCLRLEDCAALGWDDDTEPARIRPTP